MTDVATMSHFFQFAHNLTLAYHFQKLVNKYKKDTEGNFENRYEFVLYKNVIQGVKLTIFDRVDQFSFNFFKGG